MLLTNDHIASCRKGIALIDIFIVAAIVGILGAVAIPNSIGMQTEGRIRSLKEYAVASKVELRNWMMVVRDKEPDLIDLDGNGTIDAADNAILAGLSITTIPAQWDKAHGPSGLDIRSPFGDRDRDGRVEYLFNREATAGSGQIAVACAEKVCTLTGYSDDAAAFPIITAAAVIQ